MRRKSWRKRAGCEMQEFVKEIPAKSIRLFLLRTPAFVRMVFAQGIEKEILFLSLPNE